MTSGAAHCRLPPGLTELLQRAEIVGISQLAAQRLEVQPVFRRAIDAELTDQAIAEVVLHRVIVQQRIVAIEEEYHVDRITRGTRHRPASFAPSAASTIACASAMMRSR